MTPKALLTPLAHALAKIFFTLVKESSDSQRGAEWIFTHDEMHEIPLDYKARLRIDLMYDRKEKKE